MGNQDVSTFDPSHSDDDGLFVQGCAIVDIEGETRHLEAHIGDRRECLGIVLCRGGSIPTRGHARGLPNCFGSTDHLGLQMRNIRVTENPIDPPVHTDDRRHVPRAVVLDLEQVRMRFDQRQTGRVMVQPTLGRKDRRGDAMVYQQLDQVTIEATTTRIQRHGHDLVRPRRWQIEHLVYFYRALPCTHFQREALQQ